MYNSQIKDQIIKAFLNKVQPFFRGLSFIPQSHEYFVEDKKVPISVSGVVKGFVPFTDWDKIATAIAKRDNTTKEEVLKQWADKRDKGANAGTKVHDFAETQDRLPTSEKEVAVLKFWSDLELNNPYRYILIIKELEMYHKLYKFAGKCDFILYDTLANIFIIGDYKTNIDLFKNYNGNLLLEPFEFLLDHPYNQYQIQLSSYQILLSQIDGLIVGERWLVHLKDDKTYHTYKTYDYSNYLTNYFNNQVRQAYQDSSEISMSI